MWELGILRIEGSGLDTELSLLPEELSLQVACWLGGRDTSGEVVGIPLTPEDIDRVRDWLKCAEQNAYERRERAKRS